MIRIADVCDFVVAAFLFVVEAALGEYSGRTAIYRVQEPEKSQLDWLDEDDREDCNQ